MTGAHPYDERLDHEVFDRTATDNSQMTAATSRRRTSAQSWNEFRSRNPNGTVGDGPQSEQEAEWRRVESRCSRFGVSPASTTIERLLTSDRNFDRTTGSQKSAGWGSAQTVSYCSLTG